MKLLVAASSAPDGGAGISSYAKDLTEVMRQKGHSVTYVAPAPDDDSWLRQHGVKLFPLGQHDDPLEAAKALVSLVRTDSIDAIINNDHPFVQSIAPAVPCVFIAVGHLQNTSVASLACHNAAWLDYVVTISNDMRDRYIRKFELPTWKAPLIYNGVPDRGYDRQVAERNGPLQVIFAGGSNRRKGADRVLDLAMQLGRQDLGVELNWFGTLKADDKTKLQSRADVVLRGHTPREEFLETLRQADILLHPSRVEGCPMTLLEGFCFGVASIVSDGLGAMEEIVINGHNGYVCPTKDWGRRALECLTFLANRRHILEDLKQNSRKRYETGFKVEMTAANIEHLLLNPTIDRSAPRTDISVLHWHRPFLPGSTRAPLADRFRIRLGILREAGRVQAA